MKRICVFLLTAVCVVSMSGCSSPNFMDSNFKSVTCASPQGDMVKVDMNISHGDYDIQKVARGDYHYITIWDGGNVVGKIDFGSMDEAAQKVSDASKDPLCNVEVGGSNGNNFFYVENPYGDFQYFCESYSGNENLALLLTMNQGYSVDMDIISFLYIYPAGTKRPDEDWVLPEPYGVKEEPKPEPEPETETETEEEEPRVVQKEYEIDGSRRNESGAPVVYTVGYHLPAGDYYAYKLDGTGGFRTELGEGEDKVIKRYQFNETEDETAAPESTEESTESTEKKEESTEDVPSGEPTTASIESKDRSMMGSGTAASTEKKEDKEDKDKKEESTEKKEDKKEESSDKKLISGNPSDEAIGTEASSEAETEESTEEKDPVSEVICLNDGDLITLEKGAKIYADETLKFIVSKEPREESVDDTETSTETSGESDVVESTEKKEESTEKVSDKAEEKKSEGKTDTKTDDKKASSDSDKKSGSSTSGWKSSTGEAVDDSQVAPLREEISLPSCIVMDECSDEDKAHVFDYWSMIPENVRKAFQDDGWTLYIVPDSYAIERNYPDVCKENGYNYSGLTDNNVKMVTVEAKTLRQPHTLFHEMGHFVDFYLGMPSRSNNFLSIYGEECEKAKVLFHDSSYVCSSPQEYFADMMMQYWMHPSREYGVPATMNYLKERSAEVV